jgi:hypothetical protein
LLWIAKEFSTRNYMGDSASGFSKPSRNRGNLRKRNVEEEVEDDSAFALEDLEGMRKAKIQKKTPLTFSTKDEAKNKSVKILYESDRKLQQASDQGATREVETETAKDNDARYTAPSSQLASRLPC